MANQTDSIFQSDMEIKRSIPGQWQSISSLISPQIPAVDFGEIKGQYLAKRVLEIAAAGSHHTMLIGLLPAPCASPLRHFALFTAL